MAKKQLAPKKKPQKAAKEPEQPMDTASTGAMAKKQLAPKKKPQKAAKEPEQPMDTDETPGAPQPKGAKAKAPKSKGQASKGAKKAEKRKREDGTKEDGEAPVKKQKTVFYVDVQMNFQKLAEKITQESFQGVQKVVAHHLLRCAEVFFSTPEAKKAALAKGPVTWNKVRCQLKEPKCEGNEKTKQEKGPLWAVLFFGKHKTQLVGAMVRAAWPHAQDVDAARDVARVAFHRADAAAAIIQDGPKVLFGDVTLTPVAPGPYKAARTPEKSA